MIKLLNFAFFPMIVSSAATAAQDCPRLKAPDRIAFPSGQLAAATLGPSKEVRRPKQHVETPAGPLEGVRILLQRSICYGSCPSYSVELGGDGTGSYDGDAFVLVHGRHAFKVDKASVACLLADFRKIGFWSLADAYTADITDGPTYSVSLTIGGRTKTVADYFGSAVGMPALVSAIEGEIDRVGGTDRWVTGSAETLATLRAEHFDFHSAAAGTILASAVAKQPEALIDGLIAAGTPVTGRSSTALVRGVTAIESASRAGRLPIVRKLIAAGAFATASPGDKGQALIAAAASGEPVVVAEILAAHPDVNARDRRGATALRAMWQSNDLMAYSSRIDVAEVARLLLAAGAEPNLADNGGDTALFSATNADVVRLLLEAGAKIDARNQFGMTPLLAALSDQAAVALIEAGADIDAKDKNGYDVDQKVAHANFPETKRALVEKRSRRETRQPSP